MLIKGLHNDIKVWVMYYSRALNVKAVDMIHNKRFIALTQETMATEFDVNEFDLGISCSSFNMCMIAREGVLHLCLRTHTFVLDGQHRVFVTMS